MKHVYVAERSSGLNFTVIYKNEDEDEIRYPVKFVNGQFKTDDDAIAEAIDALIAKVANIRSRCRKADMQAAEALARAHKVTMANTGAFKGGATTIAMKQAMSTEMQQRDVEIKSSGVDIDEMKDKESLILTEKATTVASPGLAEGATDAAIDAQAKVVDKKEDDATAPAKSIFAKK